ncbi:MAG: hypothetical protein Alpg2KO_20700 [Alphaproteobacteria bacterium]
MTRGFMSIMAGAALLVLAGCAGQPVGSGNSLDKLDQMVVAQGKTFEERLAAEYRDLATFEQYQMFDYADAEWFAARGLKSAMGERVEPADFTDFKIAQHHVEDLKAARIALMDAFERGSREFLPFASARAQAKFDCWLEQQEENWQYDHIASCRDEFNAAMSTIEQRFRPAPEPTRPLDAAQSEFVIYFNHDSKAISPNGKGILDRITSIWLSGVYREMVMVTGHADRSGSYTYNNLLAQGRAMAVRDGLVRRGVESGKIVMKSYGEYKPVVSTRDGVKELANRRVTVILR